jgi:DNA-binding response OmpR family regulator
LLASDGEEGVVLFSAFQPDLVITDLQMPRLNGRGGITHVHSVAPATPVIIFTSYAVVDAECKSQDFAVPSCINIPFMQLFLTPGEWR